MTEPREDKKYSNEENIKIWEKIIDVQKHFNEVKSKNQTLFISIITASLGATGYLWVHQKNPIPCPFTFTFTLNLYTLPILGAVIFTLAFYILDFGVYHTLLKGAVECGKDYEKKVLNLSSLTSTKIEEYSEKHEIKFIPGTKGAGRKLNWFYGLIGGSLAILFFILNCI